MSQSKLSKMQKDIDKKNKEISILEKRLNKKDLIGQSSKSKFRKGNTIRDKYKQRKERLQKEIKQIKQDRIELKSNMKLKDRPSTQPKFDTATGKAENKTGRDFVNRDAEVKNASKARLNIKNNTEKTSNNTSTSGGSSNAEALKIAAAKRRAKEKVKSTEEINSKRKYKSDTLVKEKLDDDALKVARAGIANKKTVVDNLNKSVKGGKNTLKDNPQAQGVGGKRKAAEAMATLESKANKSPNKSASSKKDSVGKEIARALLGPQKKSKIGKFTADSTARGMSKFMGTDKEIADQEMDEEMNFRKGGMPSKKTYGMRAGGFTKRGGMYKKGY